jgi:hypothetical protein
MAEFYRQFAFVSSVLAGFSFTFYGTLLIAARQHPAFATTPCRGLSPST